MARGQGLDGSADIEQPGDEILELGRQGDQQLRLAFGIEHARVRPRRHQSSSQVRSAGGEMGAEQAIDPGQPFRLVKIGEAQSVGERQFGHLERRNSLLCGAKAGS